MWNVKQQSSKSIDCVVAPHHNHLNHPPTSFHRLVTQPFDGGDTSSLAVSVGDAKSYHSNTSKTTTNNSPPSPAKPPFKMVNRLKSLVSKQKKRFQADGFDLDLSYISPRIIAMGFPAERVEGLYRNHIGEVSRFFEQKHKGHYKIYHLCNERDFDACRFSGPVVRYPFSDHNAPQFDQILALCDDVRNFLNRDPDNIVAINCKAGKGRTGVMVCACLMEMQEARDADDALRIYAEQRTRNGQGVTIPSQRRYVRYYSRLINSNLVYHRPTPLRLTSICIEGLQHQLHGITSFELSLSVHTKESPNCSHNALTTSDGHHKKQPWASSLESGWSEDTCQTSDTCLQKPHQPTHLPVILPPFDHHHRVSPLSGSSNTVDLPPLPPIVDPHHPSSSYNSPSGACSFPIPCSTHMVDGDYIIRLDELVTVSGDFRIKLKAKAGVLTKKIGQCWLNTLFIVDECNQQASGLLREGCLDRLQGSSASSLHRSDNANTDNGTLDHLTPPIPKEERRRQPRGRRFSTDEGMDPNQEDEEEEDMEEEEEDMEEEVLGSSVSCSSSGSCNSSSASSASSVSFRNSPPNFEDWSPGDVNYLPSSTPSNNTPLKISTSSQKREVKKSPIGIFSPPTATSTIQTNVTPKTATANATPSTIFHLQLQQSDLDDAFKGKIKRLPNEEFKISFEFCQENSSHNLPSISSNLPSSSSLLSHADVTSSDCPVAMATMDEVNFEHSSMLNTTTEHHVQHQTNTPAINPSCQIHSIS